MGKFKVGDSIVIVKAGSWTRVGDVGEITTVATDDSGVIASFPHDGRVPLDWTEFKSNQPKLTKNKRITALETELTDVKKEVSELKLIVHELRERKPSTVMLGVDYSTQPDETVITFEGAKYRKVDREAREGDVVVLNDVSDSDYFEVSKPYKVQKDVYINGVGKNNGHKEAHPVYREQYNRTPETVDVYELIVEDKQPTVTVNGPLTAHIHEVGNKPKTSNQLRAVVIEKAKGFVESQFKKHWNDSGDLVVSDGFTLHTVDFVINEEKRQVNALLRSYSKRGKGAVDYNGKAKCNPSDVFNEHIGKAIALGRALKLDVSEFEQAVQPNEPVVGMRFIDHHGDTREIVNNEEWCTRESMKSHIDSDNIQRYPITIINDSNAIYGGVE